MGEEEEVHSLYPAVQSGRTLRGQKFLNLRKTEPARRRPKAERRKSAREVI